MNPYVSLRPELCKLPVAGEKERKRKGEGEERGGRSSFERAVGKGVSIIRERI